MAEEGGRFSYVPLTEVSVKTGEFQGALAHEWAVSAHQWAGRSPRWAGPPPSGDLRDLVRGRPAHCGGALAHEWAGPSPSGGHAAH